MLMGATDEVGAGSGVLRRRVPEYSGVGSGVLGVWIRRLFCWEWGPEPVRHRVLGIAGVPVVESDGAGRVALHSVGAGQKCQEILSLRCRVVPGVDEHGLDDTVDGTSPLSCSSAHWSATTVTPSQRTTVTRLSPFVDCTWTLPAVRVASTTASSPEAKAGVAAARVNGVVTARARPAIRADRERMSPS